MTMTEQKDAGLPNPSQLRTMARPASPCVPGRCCERYARGLGACVAGHCNPPSTDGVAPCDGGRTE